VIFFGNKQFIQEKSSLLYLFLLEKHHFRNLFVFLQRNVKNAMKKSAEFKFFGGREK